MGRKSVPIRCWTRRCDADKLKVDSNLAANRCLGADKSKTETNFLENERFSAGGWILVAVFV